MGLFSSKLEQGEEGMENHLYVLENIEKISLKGKRILKYGWIDPRVYNGENQKYLQSFMNHFQMETFTTLEGFKSFLSSIGSDQSVKVLLAASLDDEDYKYLAAEETVEQMFLFCGNEERAKLLKRNFDKIKGYGLNGTKVIQVMKAAEQLSDLELPDTTILLTIEQDTKLINLYRLNYFCLINKKSRAQGKEDFTTCSKALYPSQSTEITEFQKTYDLSLTGEAAYNQVFDWVFKDNFFWSMVNQLPKTSTDPRVLAYLRMPFGDLYEAIFMKHKENPKTKMSLYIVVKLSSKEIQKITGTLGRNYLIFSTFVRGYTKESPAIQECRKEADSFLFEVLISQANREPEIDFGYFISPTKNKKNVIFNIFNLFLLDQFDLQEKRGLLKYGSLAEAYMTRANAEVYRVRLSEPESKLLRNYDYVHQLKKGDDQVNILQQKGFFQDALNVLDFRIKYLEKIDASPQSLTRYYISRGDALRMLENYDEAEICYKKVKDRPDAISAQVHLIELYIKKKEDKRLDEAVKEIIPDLQYLKEKLPEEGFKAEYFITLNKMKKGRFKQALQNLDRLFRETCRHYKHRFESIPLMHDIIKSKAVCQAQLGNHDQALNLLEQMHQLEITCGGQTEGLAQTQRLMYSIHERLNDSDGIDRTKAAIDQIEKSINANERRYKQLSNASVSDIDTINIISNSQHGKSFSSPAQREECTDNQSQAKQHRRKPQQVNANIGSAVNINQSTVNVNLNPRLDQRNIQQSSVNVNLDQRNIQQSSVNVNLDQKNIQQSSVNVNMNPKFETQNIQQSVVNVKMDQQYTQPNIQQSIVKVNMDMQPVHNLNQSLVNVLLDPWPQQNMNQSTVQFNQDNRFGNQLQQSVINVNINPQASFRGNMRSPSKVSFNPAYNIQHGQKGAPYNGAMGPMSPRRHQDLRMSVEIARSPPKQEVESIKPHSYQDLSSTFGETNLVYPVPKPPKTIAQKIGTKLISGNSKF